MTSQRGNFLKEPTPGLVWEFEVWFSWLGAEPTMRRVTAATERLARAAFDVPEARITSINVVRPVLDDHRQWFGLAATAAYLGVPISTVQTMMAEGQLPRPAKGRPMFNREWLDELLRKRMGKDGE